METWERAKEIFHAASDLPPDERSAYLATACGDDAALRAEVEALLDARRDAGSFLGGDAETAASPASPLAEGPGTRIGRYKLLQKIGEGGFGAVYMAEQEEPVRRKVALKIIKLGMDTRQVIARFEAERQALALMDHPNIARVLDAGATDTGRPFFVMELVRGVPVTTYCDQNNLSTRQRLELFLAVCGAVQHAHQKGIIHRDIKPSNVMITLHDGTPVPKVIDFGIAKATNQRLTEKTLFTQYHQFIGTPQYMSPEQAEMSGLDVDTRTDIYSLGVLLYELLTGTTPVDPERLRSMAYAKIHQFIRDEEPPRPSTRVSTMGDAATDTAKHRSTDARTLCRALSGDLDWIVMKALEKDRTRRYETANGFMLDVRRHLDNEPVLASPPTPAYRLKKFVRRNRTAVAVGTSVVAALLGGLGLATYGFLRASHERRIAEQEAEASEAINGFFNDMLASVNPLQLHLHTAFAPSGPAPDLSATFEHGVSVEQMLLGAIERMDEAFPGKPLLEAEARETIAATLLGLGAADAAVEQLELALAVRRRVLPENDREVLRSRVALGTAEKYAARMVHAEEIAREVLEDLERAYGPEDPLTLSAASLYAGAAGEQAKMAIGDSVFAVTIERQRRVLGNDHRDTIESLILWAGLYCWRNDGAAAEALTSEAYALTSERYSPDDAIAIAATAQHALALTFLGRDEEAEAIARPGLERARRVLGDRSLLTGFMTFALLRSLDWDEDAEEVETRFRMTDGRPDIWVGRRDFGNFLLRHDRVEEALDVFEEQYEYWRAFSDPEYVAQERLDRIRSQAIDNYRTGLMYAGRHEELAVVARSGLSDLEAAARRENAGSDEWNTYAWELVTAEPTALRDPEEAMLWAGRAVEAARQSGDVLQLQLSLDTSAKALELSGRIEEAYETQRAVLAAYLEQEDARKTASHVLLRDLTIQVVRYATELGDHEMARDVVEQAQSELEQLLEPGDAVHFVGILGARLERRGFYDLAQGPRRRALELARAGVDLAESGSDREPRRRLLAALTNLAALRARAGDAIEAESLLQEATALYADLFVTEPIEWKPKMGYTDEGEISRNGVESKSWLARACVAAEKLDVAERLLFEIRCSNAERDPRVMGDLRWARGDVRTAKEEYRRRHFWNLRNGRWDSRPGEFARDEAKLGRCLAWTGAFQEAERHLLGGYERALEWGGPRSQNVVEIAGWIEELYERWGKAELAAEWRAR